MNRRSVMIAVSSIACILLSLLVACSDDVPLRPPVGNVPTPLAQMTFGWGFGSWADSVQHVVMSIGYSPLGSRGYLTIVNLDEHQQGDTLTIDRGSSAAFEPFAAMLTNGVADTVASGLGVWALHGGMWMGGGTTPEADSLLPRAGHTGVDLADTTVSRIELTINRLRIAIPGSDLNHDGRWADVGAVVTMSVY